MWSYYGSKSKIAHLYPRPKYDKIIEPFAGTARYSLLYWDHDITLVDKYEVIVRIWKWLQKCSPQDILSLPILKLGDRISREMFDCDEQFWFMGFLVSEAVGMPRKQVSMFANGRLAQKKRRIASQLHKIKHWKIIHASYEEIENQEAVWFIDPPYQNRGMYQYKFNNSGIDFHFLGEWCNSREGQVIVCENIDANWLPFRLLTTKNSGVNHKRNTEAIWSNLPTDYDIEQLSLFNKSDYA